MIIQICKRGGELIKELDLEEEDGDVGNIFFADDFGTKPCYMTVRHGKLRLYFDADPLPAFEIDSDNDLWIREGSHE